MKVAVLFSGGKDSNYSLYQASLKNEVKCLISLISKRTDSYMFQSDGNEFLDFQSEALQIPLIKINTSGEKEKELVDLKKAIILAKEKYGIEAIVSGAIASNYQSLRIQTICNDLNLWCFNPVWQIDEKEYLDKLIKEGFKIKIVRVASYPFDEKVLGKIIDENFKNYLISTSERFGISCVGEGGEFETFVMDSPLFKKSIIIENETKIMESENCGYLNIQKMRLNEK